MEITEKIIERFFSGDCSPAEAEAVKLFLESNPEALEKYIGKAEWDNIEVPQSQLPAVQSKRMYKHIKSAISHSAPAKRSTKLLAIAASIMLIAGAYFFLDGPVNSNIESAKVKHPEAWKLIKNTGEDVKRFELEDGSYIALDPSSELMMPVHFRPDSRLVKLNGKAFFSVAKDAKRPFKVIADNTSTTALGTQFIIQARKGLTTTNIELLEGKVLIKVSNKLTGTVMQHYLIPNQELIYKKSSGLIAIRPTGKNVSALNHDNAQHITPGTQLYGISISFNREPVSAVFRALESAYKVEINFPAGGLEDHYFTGSFYADDALDRILQVIAKTNDLEVKKTRSGYQIRTTTNKLNQ
jgi:transmembrane sensor